MDVALTLVGRLYPGGQREFPAQSGSFDGTNGPSPDGSAELGIAQMLQWRRKIIMNDAHNAPDDSIASWLKSLDALADQFVEINEGPNRTIASRNIRTALADLAGLATHMRLSSICSLACTVAALLPPRGKELDGPLAEETESLLLAGIDEAVNMLERVQSGSPPISDPEFHDVLLSRIIAAGKSEKGKWAKVRVPAPAIAEVSPVEIDEEAVAKPEEVNPWLELTTDTNEPITVGCSVEMEMDSSPEKIIPEPEEKYEAKKSPTELEEGFNVLLEDLVADLDFEEIEPDGTLGQVDDMPFSPLGKASQKFEIGTDIEDYLSDSQEESVSLLEEMVSEIEIEEPEPEALIETVSEEPPASEPADILYELPALPSVPIDYNMLQASERDVNDLQTCVGDLIVVGEMYAHLQTRLIQENVAETTVVEFRRVNETLASLSDDLQRGLRNIRNISIEPELQALLSAAQAEAARLGLTISISLQCEGVTADKAVLELVRQLVPPLIRNALTHGIEPEQERTAGEKSPEGTLSISARQTEDSIILVVSDDGRGCQIPESIGNQSLIGYLSSRSSNSSGSLSLAAIRSQLTSCSGSIHISTEQEKGFAVQIEIPDTVSTQILTGFIILINSQCYILPMERIIRCFRPTQEQIKVITGTSECVVSGGEVIPICRFAQFCGLEQEMQSLTDGLLIVVKAQERKVALHVDSIEGVRQVVLKNVLGLPDVKHLFLGAALIGSGSVAMILDTERILSLATSDNL